MLTIRKELEINVCAVNKVLREKVSSMTIIELLRNCHPAYRPDFTHHLLKDGVITKTEALEFVKIL